LSKEKRGKFATPYQTYVEKKRKRQHCYFKASMKKGGGLLGKRREGSHLRKKKGRKGNRIIIYMGEGKVKKTRKVKEKV